MHFSEVKQFVQLCINSDLVLNAGKTRETGFAPEAVGDHRPVNTQRAIGLRETNAEAPLSPHQS